MASESPAAILFNEDGTNAVTVSGHNGQHLLLTSSHIDDPGPIALETTLQTRATEATALLSKNELIALNAKDFASESTLASLDATASGLATEATLALLEAKDFATQATLNNLYNTAQTLAKETTVSGQLQAIIDIDFATETTQLTRATEATLSSLYTTAQFINNKIATEATLSGLRIDFNAEDFATQTTLSNVYTTAQLIHTVTSGIKTSVDAIRLTDGIKKITDPLPSGTNRLGLIRLVDKNDANLPVERGIIVPSGIHGLLGMGEDDSNVARSLDVRIDSTDGKRRLQIEGKVVAVTTPTAPPTATSVQISADSPLSITSTTDSDYIITAGKTFYLQQVVGGSEGDTSERGSVIEVYYFDGTTLHVVERIYLNGFTTYIIVNDISRARDGTTMSGNGTTRLIRVRRRRLSGSSQEVDGVVRGYEQ